jgi:hypothetical protein
MIAGTSERRTWKRPVKAALKNLELAQRINLWSFQTRSRHLTVQSAKKPDSKILQKLGQITIWRGEGVTHSMEPVAPFLAACPSSVAELMAMTCRREERVRSVG